MLLLILLVLLVMLILLVLWLQRVNIHRRGLRGNIDWLYDWSDRQFGWIINLVRLYWQVCTIGTVSVAVSDVISSVGDTVGPNVAVIATNDFVRANSRRRLLRADSIVGVIVIPKAAIRPTIVRRLNGLRVCVRVQVSWHLKPVVPTTLARLTATRIAIAIIWSST